MSKCSTVILLILLTLFFTNYVYAYRPFETEDADVTGKGDIELEMGWDFLKWGNNDEENEFVFVPKFGIIKNFELAFVIPYIIHNPDKEENEKGIGDIEIAIKYLLIKERENIPQFALQGIIKTASGNYHKKLGSGDEDYSIVGILSKTIKNFKLHGMFGYTFVGDGKDDDLRNIYLYGFGIEYKLLENFSFVSEISGFKHPDNTSHSDPASGLIGGIYQISEKLKMDFGFRFGFNNEAPDWSTTTGITIGF